MQTLFDAIHVFKFLVCDLKCKMIKFHYRTLMSEVCCWGGAGRCLWSRGAVQSGDRDAAEEQRVSAAAAGLNRQNRTKNTRRRDGER